ncbi:SRPBCC family protein [Saccharothrix longispora]|uniref:Uncharacterized protein YndB with AHSA1/START domain n=1 Tax=Saccharothrix longispora TaxID=33920 RepID=A0ABU1PU79_9PSEU|nr:SRPBCC family protein [Saccharothrix longispora]MDR6594197.1 uncharacterized protein YndB with AHSA1/START domain [Saccharothrix longispora]
MTVPPAERTRSMPVDAEAVFEVITDLEDLSSWLPAGVEVDCYGAHLVRLWVGGEVVERRIAVDWDSLGITWGDPHSPTYTGTVRVLRVAPGRSAVTVRLTGSAGLPPSRLDDWLVRALDELALVAGVHAGPRGDGGRAAHRGAGPDAPRRPLEVMLDR